MKLTFHMLFFIGLGFTTEIFFTALSNLFNNQPYCGEPLWSLTGKTYGWMAFIYGSIPLIGTLLIDKVMAFPLWTRLLMYTLLIYVIEFLSGYALEMLLGKCPWEYQEGWHIMGYIRLDYFPAWLLFGFVLEKLFLYVDDLIPSPTSE